MNRRPLGMIATVFVVVGAGIGIGSQIGLGPAAVLAGLIALFTTMAAFGGPLRSDLRLMAWFGPTIIVTTSGARLLGEVSPAAAIALVTLVVLVAGLVPVWGTRYASVGMGLSFATLFGYGMQLTNSATNLQVVGASVLAVALVLVLRVLGGIGDPAKQTRDGIAAVLDAERPSDGPGTGSALRTWAGDRPVRWLGTVLGAAHRYQLTAAALASDRHRLGAGQSERLDADLDAVRTDAGALAAAVRAKKPARTPAAPDRPDPDDADLPTPTRRLLAELRDALDEVRTALTTRDTSLVEIPRRLRWEAAAVVAGSELSWRSAQLRHALRCALGVLVALLLARLRPGDPLTATFLLTTLGILQQSWQATFTKARQRIVGCVIGAAILAVVLLALPAAALLPISGAALLVAFWFMQSQPVVFNAGIVLVSVGLTSSTRHLDPVATLVEYLVLIALAVVIGLLFGFAVIPGVRTGSPVQRLTAAVTATHDLLATIARGERARPVLLRVAREASRAQQDLALPPKPSAPGEADALDSALDALRGITAAAGLIAVRPESRADTVAFAKAVAAALADPGAPDASPDEGSDDDERLLHAAVGGDLGRLRDARRLLEPSSHAE